MNKAKERAAAKAGIAEEEASNLPTEQELLLQIRDLLAKDSTPVVSERSRRRPGATATQSRARLRHAVRVRASAYRRDLDPSRINAGCARIDPGRVNSAAGRPAAGARRSGPEAAGESDAAASASASVGLLRRAGRGRQLRAPRRRAPARCAAAHSMTSIGCVSVSAVGRLGRNPEHRRDPRRDGGRVAVQVERVHAHVVPAEAAQDLRAQPQRLAQRLADRLGVALGDDGACPSYWATSGSSPR